MKDRIVVVTGGAGALGRAVIAELAARGAIPVAVDLADAAVADAALTLPGVDIAEPGAATRAVEAVLDRFGRLDGLANVAGGFVWQTLSDGSLSQWDRMYRVNLGTATAMTRAALPPLVKAGGAIVNVGANGAVHAASGMGAYAASKAGVHKLTESLAAELKDEGVRVNAVLPSILDTPAGRAQLPDSDFSRWVRPAELARTIAFLLSDDARAITGALVPVIGRV